MGDGIAVEQFRHWLAMNREIGRLEVEAPEAPALTALKDQEACWHRDITRFLSA
jgi:hypothetical protein